MKAERLKFQHIDHTADAGLKITGDSPKELFENAAMGMFSIISDLVKVDSVKCKKITIQSPDNEALLVDWLAELNYIFLTKRFIFNKFEIQAMSQQNLSAIVSGEPLDLAKHEIFTEIKAVTFHGLYIAENPNGFEAQVIFDL